MGPYDEANHMLIRKGPFIQMPAVRFPAGFIRSEVAESGAGSGKGFNVICDIRPETNRLTDTTENIASPHYVAGGNNLIAKPTFWVTCFVLIRRNMA